jgi:hypothetical protein
MEEKEAPKKAETSNGFAERMGDYSGIRVYRNGKLLAAIKPSKKESSENNTK